MEIKNVLFLKPAKAGKSKESRRIWSSVIVIILSATVVLTNCGAKTANMAEKAPAPISTVSEIMAGKGLKVDYISYEVKPGDTVSGIAAKHSDKWPTDTPLAIITEAIVEHNAKIMPNGYVLQSGTTIEVPVWR